MLAVSASYLGTGSAQTISGLTFQPDAVFVKVGGVGTLDTWFVTKDMPVGRSLPVRSDAAGATNRITALTSDGFSVGTDNAVNQSGLTYYYLALKDDGLGDFSTVTYTGDALDDKLVFTAWQPDWAILKADFSIVGAQKFAGQSSQLATPTSNMASMHFQSGPDRADLISFLPGGLYVSNGSGSGGNLVNQSAQPHYGVVMKNSANFVTGSYTGTGAAQTISLPISPVFINLHATTSQPPVMQYQAAQAGNTTNPFDGANTTGKFSATTPTGFTLTTDAAVNGSGVTYWYMAVAAKTNPTNKGSFFSFF